MPRVDPRWWKDEHTSAWDRVKAALRRDWEQTKADLSAAGTQLNQTAADTIRQVFGAEPIPPPTVPNAEDDWEKAEGEYRFGVGAHHQYSHEYEKWDDRVEGKLSAEWDELKSGRAWDDAKHAIRRGWDRAGPGG